MEHTINTSTTNAGKGLGVSGFVIALVALVLWIFVSGAAVLSAVAGGGMGLAIFWIILSSLGAGLSLMGLMKALKGGGKKGLAITGIVLGLLATILSVRTVFAVKEAHSIMNGMGTELIDKMQGLQQVLDSVKTESSEEAAK